MNLFQRIGNGLMSFVHDDLEPWLASLLKNTSHAVMTAIVPLATEAVKEEEQVLISAAASGDFSGFAAASGRVLAATATKVEAAGLNAGVGAVVTAVDAALAHHDGIQAASAAAVMSAAPATASPTP